MIAVEPSDREDAAAVTVMAELRPLILEGRCDDGPVVQQFAKARVRAKGEIVTWLRDEIDAQLRLANRYGTAGDYRSAVACDERRATLHLVLESIEQGKHLAGEAVQQPAAAGT